MMNSIGRKLSFISLALAAGVTSTKQFFALPTRSHKAPPSPPKLRRKKVRYGDMLKAHFDLAAFAGSGRAERHAQYVAHQAARKLARIV
jgi:hypothetical protein